MSLVCSKYINENGQESKMNKARLFSGISLIISAVSLTGCDAGTTAVNRLTSQIIQSHHFPEPALVFAPGYQIDVDGHEAQISGFDDCPKSDAMMRVLFGPDPLEGAKNCIVLRPDRTAVEVQIYTQNGSNREIWKIYRETRETHDRPYSFTALIRPDGTSVKPFKS